MNTYSEKKTNLFGGIIGALIGAAIGAAAWMCVAKAGYIVSLLGLLIAFLAAKGYDICKGPQNGAKIVIVIICVILAVVGGNYGAIYWTIDEQYDEMFGAYGSVGLVSKEDFRDTLMATPEVSDALMEDTLKGLGFAAIGCAGVIASGINNRKKRKAEEAARAQAEYEQNYAAAYDPNTYAEPASYDENGYPVESEPAEPAYTYEPAPAAYTAEEETPAYSAPAREASSYSAGYKFSSMRTAAPARPAAPAPAPAAAAKKNPFVKPEFANNFNTGKVAPKEPAKPANGPQTFYSDK